MSAAAAFDRLATTCTFMSDALDRLDSGLTLSARVAPIVVHFQSRGTLNQAFGSLENPHCFNLKQFVFNNK